MRWLNRFFGDRGEREAARFLRRRGYKILVRKFRTRFGEIDLIARDDETIVFVEVKTRSTNQAGHPTEAITPAKQRRLTQLALAFLKRYGLLERRARFDVVSIVWSSESRPPTIEHFPNAFEAVGRFQMHR